MPKLPARAICFFKHGILIALGLLWTFLCMLNSLGLFTTVLGVQYSLRINISASNSITKTQIHNRHNHKETKKFKKRFTIKDSLRILWFRFQIQKIAKQNSKEPRLNTTHGSRTRTRNLYHRKSNLASIASLISGNSKKSC